MRCLSRSFVISVIFLQSFLFWILTAKFVGKQCFEPNNKRYKIKRLSDRVADSLSECDDFLTPEASNPGFGYVCEEGAVILSWSVGGSRYRLGGFLLEVTSEADGPIVTTEYLHVNVPKYDSSKKSQSVKYHCFDTTSVYKISVIIWPLTTKREKCGRRAGPISINTGYGNLQGKCDAILCVCQAKVDIQAVENTGRGSIQGKISISNVPPGTNISLSVELWHNGSLLRDWSMWSGGRKTILIEQENVLPGIYYFRVHRRCRTHPDTQQTCGRMDPDVMRSMPVRVDSFRTDTLTGQALDTNREEYDVLPLVLICSSIVALFIAVIAWLVACRRGNRRRRRFTNAQRIYRQLRVENERKRTALIFAKDNRAHIQRVNRLQTELMRHGVEAVLIDDSTDINMMENWIDLGEQIPVRFDVLLFIMSPILYELCHRHEASLIEMAETGHAHAFHKLPAAVLHTLSVKPYYREDKFPKVFVVSLDRTRNESNPTIRAFLREHLNKCHPKPIFLKEMPKGLGKLVKLINAQPTVFREARAARAARV